MDIVVLAAVVTILGLVLCWLLGKEYYRGWKPLWFSLLIVTTFLLSWWILKVTQISLWDVKPLWPLVLGFLLSSLMFYWALRKASSCNDDCDCFCSCEGCSCSTGGKKVAAASVASAPKAKASGKKDDLKLVEGIGPKIESLLHADGIRTFKNLQDAKVKKLKKILEKAGKRFQMHDPSTWPAQAEYLVKGDLKGLEEYQDFLQGGRE